MTDFFVNDGGDLRVEDENGNVVARYDESADEWDFNTPTNISSLADVSSGATVYDSATETFGDGTQAGNLNTLTTTQFTSARTRYISSSDDLQTALGDFTDYDTVVLTEDYTFNSGLTWNASGRLIIPPNTTLKQADGASGNVFFDGQAAEMEITGGGTLDFNGANISDTDGGAHLGFRPEDASKVTLRNVTLANNTEPAFRPSRCNSITCQNVTFDNVGVGAYVSTDSTPVDSVNFDGVEFKNVAADPKGNATGDMILIWGDYNAGGNPIREVTISNIQVSGAWSTSQDASASEYYWIVNLEQGVQSASIDNITAAAPGSGGSGGGVRVGTENGVAQDHNVNGLSLRGTGSANGARGIQLSSEPATATGNTVRGFPGANITTFFADTVIVGNNAGGDVTNNSAGSPTIANNG